MRTQIVGSVAIGTLLAMAGAAHANNDGINDVNVAITALKGGDATRRWHCCRK